MRFPFLNRRAERTGSAAVHDPQSDAAPVEARGQRIGDMVAQSDPQLLQFFGLGGDSAGEVVTIDTALQVPAIWAAVGFLSRTLASLPVHVFDKTEGGRAARAGDPVAALLNEAPNDEISAFDWRRLAWQDVFTAGRHVSFLERNGAGALVNIWPLEISAVRVERRDGRTLYHYRDGGRPVVYSAREVLDLAFMHGKNRLSARSPVFAHAGTIGLGLAIKKYGRQFFNNGGMPPLAVEGPIRTTAGADRASADVSSAVRKAAEGGNVIALPEGHKITPLGFEPQKMQMIEAQRFVIEEIARIYSLPPVFLQDLTHGTFSNTEQQDLHFVKHALTHWVAMFEGETNLKIFGRGPRSTYAENAVAGVMRGDLKSRAEAVARQISTGQLTPNEARAMDNRPDMAGGERLYMQGAMAPVERLAEGPVAPPPPAPTPDSETDMGDPDQ